jgi:hypothetical protein
LKRSHASNGNTFSINRADTTTEWSSIPDEVEVADVESWDTLTTVFIKGRSGIATVGVINLKTCYPNLLESL